MGGRLGFGLGTVGLEQNAELREAEKWFEEMGREDEEVGAGKGKGKDGLEGMMKRMKEELKGQADALIVEAMGVERRGEGERERPPRVEETVVGRKAPTSLPVLLHLLASRLSKGMDEAVRRVGEGAVVAGSCGLGEIPAEAALVRGRMIDEVRFARLFLSEITKRGLISFCVLQEHDFVEPHCIAWVTDSSCPSLILFPSSFAWPNASRELQSTSANVRLPASSSPRPRSRQPRASRSKSSTLTFTTMSSSSSS